MSRINSASVVARFRASSIALFVSVVPMLALPSSAFAGPIFPFKVETACDYAISVAHGPAGPAADPHVIAGLPAASWSHAPFNCNYVPGPPNGVGVGHRTRHLVPTCHPGLDAPMGALWSPGFAVAAPPPGGGVAAAVGGGSRGHAPHADVFAGTLTVAYNAAGAVTGYTYSSTGKHDPANCMAACAPATANQTVPPAASAAYAAVSFVIDGATLDCSISVAAQGINRANVIGSAIYLGGPGQVGPMIFDLGNGSQWQDMQGLGIARMITSAPFPAQYLTALQHGQTYVNIQTMAFPQGEIRGQLTIPPMQTMGDMNCDGSINGKDVSDFVQAVTSSTQYAAQHPTCDINNGDMNSDGLVDESDAQDFASVLLQ